MLLFTIKFVIFFVIFYLLWQPFITTYGEWLARAGNFVWPVVTGDNAKLQLNEKGQFEGGKEVFGTKVAHVKLAHAWEFVFTMVGFLSLIFASSGLGLVARLKALILGIAGMFAAHLFHVLVFAESALAGWYVNGLLPSETYTALVEQGITPAFSYTATQYRVLLWLTNFWDTAGQHIWPVILWAALNIWYKRGREGRWAERIL